MAELRVVNSEKWCHALLTLSNGTVLARCHLPRSHDGTHESENGCTRWPSARLAAGEGDQR